MKTVRDVTVIAEQLRRRVPGGIGTYVSGLLSGLHAMGDDAPNVTLAASRARHEPDPILATGYPLRAARLPGPLLTRCWDRGLATGILRGGDVVHATSLAAVYPRGVPVTVMVHDLAWRDVPAAFPARGRRWHERALQQCLRHAAAVVTPAEQTAERLRREGAHAVHAIAEGCDHLPAPDHDAAAELLQRAGITAPYLLTVSTIEPRKNLPRLVEAYSRSGLKEPLVVVGHAGWGDALKPVEGVVLLGPAHGAVLAALYADATCLAYVPLLEGWGLPPVEAMAAGIPVVASPMPSTGGAALEVDPRDVEAIARALTCAVRDERVRSDLTSRGRARAKGLTWEAAARAHAALWDEVQP